MNSVKLNNAVEIPQIGFGICAIGTWQQDDEYVVDVIAKAIDIGYRHFDTASLYGNERSLGRAIERSNIDRSEFFITTKVWDSEQGYEETIHAFERSLERLALDYIDLYLVHWPVPEKTQYTWQAMEYLYSKQKIKSLGLSNFRQSDIEQLLKFAEIKPVYNQLELHPYMLQAPLTEYCNHHSIAICCWSPLGSGSWSGVDVAEKPISDPAIIALAEKYNATPANIILQWNLQQNRIIIPKAESTKNMLNNFSKNDFIIAENDIHLINGLDKNHRYGANPDSAYENNLKLVVPA